MYGELKYELEFDLLPFSFEDHEEGYTNINGYYFVNYTVFACI